MAVTEAVLEKVHSLPTTPGVYLWKDDYDRIIYVGKAVNLRNRVRSYVRHDPNRAVKVAAMMRRAADLEIIQTGTEMEALILENTLIKEHKPKYNIMLRDDKTYPYLKLTLQEDYPRLFMSRRVVRDGARYFGPFTDVGALHRTIRVLHQHYPLRTCRTMSTDRPCLQFHMNRCLAPCAHHVSREEYRKLAEQVLLFLEGKSGALIQSLRQEMERLAENLQFEQAGILRDDIQALMKIQERQHVSLEKGDMDIMGIARSSLQSCVQIFQVRGGKLMGRETFVIDNSEAEQEEEVTAAVLMQYYGQGAFIPREVVVPALTDTDLYSQWFTDKKGQKVSVLIPQRGYKKDLLAMAAENAATLLEQRRLQWQQDYDKTSGAVERLAQALDLPRLPQRMECFDISHTQGSETVASMTVFEGGRPAKKEYRRFKLKTVQGKPDDFASMAEIMSRRYGEKDWPLPDLIVIDGGKGQLYAALPLIRQAGVQDVPVIGLAKRIEEVFVEGQSEPILLDHRSPELQLLQQIRDEAHRFAITYHRKLRGKRNLVSVLDHIPGIGPARRKALWAAFKTMDEMKQADVEALAAVPGMNRPAAERVYAFFRLDKEDKLHTVQNKG